MPIALFRLVEITALFAVCCFGPGFLLVRRASWPGADRIAAAFGISVVLLGGAGFAIYLADLPRAAYAIATLLCAGAFAVGLADLRRILRDADARGMLLAYGASAAWILGCVALIRCFSGGGWVGDWIEHYERSRFFLVHAPLDTKFIGTYWLPARPPLMNLVCAHFLALVPDDASAFLSFQIASALLSTAVVFPVWLLARRFALGAGVPAALVVAAVAMNPMMVVNATYPWTKLLSAAFVALAVDSYLGAWRDAQRARMGFAVFALAAAVLTHYSAIPYALFFAAHYLLRGIRGAGDRRREIRQATLVVVAILGPWIGWSLATYGAGVTFGANTSAEGFQQRTWLESMEMVGGNFVSTLVPHPFRRVEWGLLGEIGWWSALRDQAFLVYQTNAIFMLGSAGAALVALALWRTRRTWDRETALFWAALTGSALLLGIASNGAPDMFGLAHVSLQPLAAIGIAALAGTWNRWPPLARRLALGGWLVDLVLGIAFQVGIQARVFGPETADRLGLFANAPEPTSGAAAANWYVKQALGISFLGDALLAASRLVALALCVAAALLLARVARVPLRP